MIEPDLKYCPQCHDEYRADIEMCAVCGIALITGREVLAREEEKERKRQSRMNAALSAADDLVTIHSAPLTDIRRFEESFAREGIATLVAGDDKNCGKGCCPSTFYLQVRREDAADAVAILEKEYNRATGLAHHDTTHMNNGIFNADAGQALCPACGHEFPTTTTTCPECGLCFA